MASYFKVVLPYVEPAPEMTVLITPDRVANGRYLATHVAACMDCHSTRDWGKFSGPLAPGTLGKGGEYFGPEMGFPGKYFSKNITPAHLKSWTDGEVFRAVTTGINKQGKALFPLMPYKAYATLDPEDIKDIIAYLRSLPPIANEVPVSSSYFPMNFLINTMPTRTRFTKKPNKEEIVSYGKYLVTMASCIDCHSPVVRGQIVVEKAFSGGREFEMPTGILRSSNITSDSESGIGNWSEELFIQKFKSFLLPENLSEVKAGKFNTLMPWSMYAGMDTTDLKAIYAYLKSTPPIRHTVIKFTER